MKITNNTIINIVAWTCTTATVMYLSRALTFAWMPFVLIIPAGVTIFTHERFMSCIDDIVEVVVSGSERRGRSQDDESK